MRTWPRWVSAAEVAAFYAVAMATIWFGDRIRPTILIVALLIVAICVGSNFLHGDSAARIGFAPSQFIPCLTWAMLIVLPVAVPLAFVALKHRFYWPWDLAWSLAGYPVWGFAQEYALLGFVNNRLEEVMAGHESLLPWVNGFLFAMAHLPNPVLMIVTFGAGVAFTSIFRRHRHLVPLALAHAIVGVAIALAFANVNGVMSVGPGYGTRVGTPVFLF